MRLSKNNIKKTSRASVSIMLAFMMLPIYTFGAAVVDGVRISSAGTMAASAADMTADAGLSDFNSVLKDVYGLFAVSSTEEELQKNLNEYFYRTINNTALTEEDPEGRKYIGHIADIFSDPSKADFKNLVNLNTESFDVEFTEGAVLANPEVLKSQITEYMKYSGPLKMSSGILNKLGAFKDFSKQNKAINAKIEYDKSLEKINKYSLNAWNSASSYNSFVSSDRFSGAAGASENEKKVRDIYKGAVKYMYMYKTTSDPVLSHDSSAEQYAHDLADDAGVRVFETASSLLSGYLPNENGEDSSFMQEIRNILADSDYSTVKRAFEKNQEMNCVKTYCDIYIKGYKKLSADEKKEKASENERVDALLKLMEKVTENSRVIRSNWKGFADAKCTDAADVLCGFCTDADEAIGYLEDLCDALDGILNSIDEAEKKGQNWKSAISDLSDGDVKTSMQNEYDAGVKGLNKSDISEYRELTVKNLEAFRNLRNFAANFKFHDESICRYFNYTDTFVSVLSERGIYSVQDAENSAAEETDSYLVPGSELNGETYTAQGTGCRFYDHLKKTFGNNSVPEADKKSAKKFLNTMNSLGDPSSLVNGVPEELKSDLTGKITQEKLDAIMAYAAVPQNDESFETGSTGGSAEQMLDGQQEILNSSGAFLSGINELAVSTSEEGIENLLVSEYIMQMFSCYTSGTENDGGKVKEVPSKTLSGMEMNAENNVFYRSEAEYILWGNEDMEKNLEYTRALIFGTRFSLNSVYAFTDSEIGTVTTTAATAIAGWTGFGVPVVKTVLTLSLALSESVIDMNTLLEGGEVPLYKNSHTWNMKPSGIINALKNNSDELVKAASEKAGKQVEDIFKKIENSAEGGIDELTETINGYVDEFADETITAAENTVNNVIFSVAVSVIEGADGVVTKENVKKLLTEKIGSIETSGNDMSSAATAELKKLILAKSDEIADIICNAYASASDGSKEKIQAAEKEVSEKIKSVVNSLRGSVKDAVKAVSTSVKETAGAGISAAGDCAEEYAKDIAGSLMTGVTTELTNKFGNISTVSSAKAPSPASALTFDYREYLRIFIMLNIMNEEKERAMLSRTAVLIDVNMNNGLKNASANGNVISPSGNFDISKAASMVTVDAEVSVNTILPGIIIPNSDSGNSHTSNNGITERTKNISVRTVLSY